MSLHRVDPRFVLPHRVKRAVVLGGLEDWRQGLASAGVDVSGAESVDGPPDLVVAPGRLVAQARSVQAQAMLIEGSRERPFRGSDQHLRRLVLRPTRQRPTLALPLDQPTAVSYALEHWSLVDRRWKKARKDAAKALVSRGLFPAWTSAVVTVATQRAGQPAFVAAARELGVPADAQWFLTFGQGDALSRNGFQLFRPAAERPEWVLKFARVPGYSERFDNDERGLQLARAAGGAVAAHAPRLVGRFQVDGVHASLETAAAGRRLRDLLLTPGGRSMKVKLIERIGGWIVELGDLTRTPPETLHPELERLRKSVVPRWNEVGARPELVDDLPPIAAVTQHNDLGAWNVVAHGDDFVVLDWENVRPAALPIWDLVYFLGNALVLLDWGAYAPNDLPPRMARLFAGDAPSSPLLFSWVRRAAEAASVPTDAVGAVVTLCWLSHSLSAGEHNVDIATFTPRDPPRTHGLEGMARAWMEHPALGAGWSVWRA